jgi:hypothetical protein
MVSDTVGLATIDQLAPGISRAYDNRHLATAIALGCVARVRAHPDMKPADIDGHAHRVREAIYDQLVPVAHGEGREPVPDLCGT